MVFKQSFNPPSLFRTSFYTAQKVSSLNISPSTCGLLIKWLLIWKVYILHTTFIILAQLGFILFANQTHLLHQYLIMQYFDKLFHNKICCLPRISHTGIANTSNRTRRADFVSKYHLSRIFAWFYFDYNCF